MLRDRTRLFRVSMIALLLSSILQFAARRFPAFHPDVVDGLAGLFLGVAIGGMCVTMWRDRRDTA